MNNPHVDFGSIPWNTVAEGAKEKRIIRDGCIMRLLEFTPPFKETEWCHKAHSGYVVEGEITIEFRDRTINYSAGDGLRIEAGAGHKHKAVVERRALLFLADNVIDD